MFQASLKRVPKLGQMVQTLSPLGRAAIVEEVANVILFLCSPSASYINGVGLTVDAGLTLGPHNPIPNALPSDKASSL